MALPSRRLAGLLVVVAALACRKSSSGSPAEPSPCGANAPTVNSISLFAGGTTNALSRPAVGQAVDLVANATDPDATAACAVPGAAVTAYTWSAVSLPSGTAAPYTFSASTGKFALTPDVAGTFTYSVVATDNTGLKSAPVEVSVSTAVCGPTVAGVRATSAGGFLVPDSANAVNLVQGSTVALDVPPAVSHAGTGSGAVTATGTPLEAHAYVVTISTAGGVGTAAYTVSIDGGAASTPTVVPASGISPLGTSGITLQFPPGGAYVAGDTYAFSTTAGSFVTDACIRQPAFAYAWSLTKPGSSQATLTTLTGASPSFTPDVSGTYDVRLVVTDSAGLSSPTAALTVNAASCGSVTPSVGALAFASGLNLTPGRTPDAGDLVELSAPGITDPNTCGSVPVTPYAYSWSLVSSPPGSTATLSSQTSATPFFVADVPNGTWQVALTVTDQLGMTSSPAFLAITSTSCGALPPKVALVPGSNVGDFMATQDLTVNGGAALHLVHASNPANDSASGAGTTLVLFYPSVPVQLAASVDPGTDACVPSKTISYRWSLAAQPAGSTAQIANATLAAPSFTPDLPGVYDFQLVLTDQLGHSSTTLLAVDTALNHPGMVGSCGTHAPTVVASVTEPIPAPAGTTPGEPIGIATQLDATGSQSPDDYRVSPYPAGCGLTRDLTYQWALTAAPAGSTAQIPSPALIDPSFVPDQAGAYTVHVTASDGINTAGRTLQIAGVAGYTSTPAPTGTVLTSTAVDGSGNPVVAWWDNGIGAVAAAQCTSNCATSNPTWASLGTIDSGLGPMTFTPEDEPRPIATLVTAGGIWVAYYTGHQAGAATTTASGEPFCSLVLSRFTAGTWTRQLMSAGTGCDAVAFGVGTQSGRYVSLAQSPTGIPAVGYWKQLSSTQTEPHFVACADGACSALGTDVAIYAASTSSKYGRWVSVLFDAAGGVHAAWYFDDSGGTGSRGLAYSFSSSFAAPSFSVTTVQFTVGIDAGRFASIASLPAGTAANPLPTPKLLIAYRDTTDKTAKLASCTAAGYCGAWTTSQILDAASTDYGRDAMLAVDPGTGYARLGYYDATNGQVRVLAGGGSSGFSRIGDLPAGASPGLSIAFGGGSRAAYSSAAGALRFFAGP